MRAVVMRKGMMPDTIVEGGNIIYRPNGDSDAPIGDWGIPTGKGEVSGKTGAVEAKAMGLMDKLEKIFMEDEYDYDDAFEETSARQEKAVTQRKAAPAAAPAAAPSARPVVSTAPAQKPKLQVHTTKTPELAMQIHLPADYKKDAQRIGNDMLAKKAVIVNFERAEMKERVRISDFLNGIAYVLDCEVRIISNAMMLYVPSGISVTTAKAKQAKA